MTKLEATAETLLVEGIKARRGLCLKLKFIGIAGAPDRLVLLPSARFYFVELKRAKGGSLEASQKVLFPILERLGFTVQVLYGEEDVAHFLSGL